MWQFSHVEARGGPHPEDAIYKYFIGGAGGERKRLMSFAWGGMPFRVWNYCRVFRCDDQVVQNSSFLLMPDSIGFPD